MQTYQKQFHQQWQHLQDPHVRALVWMLTSPNLLASDPAEYATLDSTDPTGSISAPRWHGQIARIALPDPQQLLSWINQLDQYPQVLHDALAVHKHRRLGHYAENLLAFFLNHQSLSGLQNLLFAQNLQVQGAKQVTLGEFDFLLNDARGFVHWELATKMYLFVGDLDQTRSKFALDDYIGPNQLDTFAKKADKLFNQQLLLSHHTAARALLQRAVISTQALMKGWLFYRQPIASANAPSEIAPEHCRGYWWTLQDIAAMAIQHGVILERMSWLAPAQTKPEQVLNQAMLMDEIQRRFQLQNTPVMLAIMRENGDLMQEDYRGMVVPEQWLDLAQERYQ